MVFYFTGTGNSLYVAKRLEENPISIPQVMRQENMTFFQTGYFYMILTYGNRHGGAAELAHQLCRECGIQPAYINVVLMVDNWLPSFDMEEQKQLDKQVENQLIRILADIKSRRHWISPVTDQDRAAHQEFLGRMRRMPPDAWQHLLRVTESCVGCGICEKVCPSGSIHVVNGRAVHTPGRCPACLACAHACPHKAIQLTIPEKNSQARYRNEHISLREIIQANSQTISHS